MADKIEQTIEVLIEEGNRKGFLSYAEINALLGTSLSLRTAWTRSSCC